MWFEILPSFGIVFAAMALPHVAGFWIAKGFTGRVSSFILNWQLTILAKSIDNLLNEINSVNILLEHAFWSHFLFTLAQN